MLDIDMEEDLVNRVGGKFALTALLQKRVVELNRGEPPLIEIEEDPVLDTRRARLIACQEILRGKIELAPRKELKRVTEEKEIPKIEVEPVPEEAPVEIYGSDIKKIKEQRIKELSQLLNPKTT